MKDYQLELEVGKVITEETQRLFSLGEVLLKVESGGLNHATQVYFFTGKNNKLNILVTIVSHHYNEFHKNGFTDITIFKGDIDESELNNMFIDGLVENANLQVVKVVSALLNSSGKTATLLDAKLEEEIIAKRKVRNNRDRQSELKVLGMKKLKTITGFKRGMTKVSKTRRGYFLESESKTMTLNF